MKQLISLLLCFALCLSFMPNIYATEYDYVKIQIDAGNGILTEKAIVQDEDLYLPADFYSEVTRFTFYEDQSQFLIDGQSNDNATLKIEVNTKENALVISPIKEVKLSTIIEANDSIYLPLSTMLPVLHADVAEILDGIIYIANNDLSLWELLYSFDIEAYLFDYAAEFADNIWLGKLS